MGRNHRTGGIYRLRLATHGLQGEHKRRVGNAMHGGGLHKRSMHCWHGLAATLGIMTV
jgi:hypothetical protein